MEHPPRHSLGGGGGGRVNFGMAPNPAPQSPSPSPEPEPGGNDNEPPTAGGGTGGQVGNGGGQIVGIGGGDGGSGGGNVGNAADRRLKSDISSVGSLPNGLQVYAFRYLGAPEVFLGVMAQDVLARSDLAYAVIPDPSGFLTVDYAAFGIGFEDDVAIARAGALQ